VVVTYRVRDYLRACLRSLLSSQAANIKVCVVDNASGDRSEAMVRSEFPEVVLMASPGTWWSIPLWTGTQFSPVLSDYCSAICSCHR
jgi:hypothetical protein